MSERSECFWKRVNEYEKDEMRDSISHSTSYHSYFQGYSERKVPRKNGKGYHIERIYTADYYKYKENDYVWYFHKILYLLLFAGAVLFLISGGTTSCDLNSVQFIGIGEILAWIPIVYLGYSIIWQVMAPKRMTIGDYRAASNHLKTGAFVVDIYLVILNVVMIVMMLVMSYGFDLNDLAAISAELLGTALVFLIYKVEHERNIEVIKNNTPVPYDANEIW